MIDQKQLYLIFEYVERDLKSYLESLGNKFMDAYKVKVSASSYSENHLSNPQRDCRLSCEEDNPQGSEACKHSDRQKR